MKKANLVLMAALAAAGLASVTGSMLLPTAAAAAEGQKLGAKIAKPLRAAQEAINARNWDEALANLEGARAIEPKSPYDAFMVDELSWYILLQKKDYDSAKRRRSNGPSDPDSCHRADMSVPVAQQQLGDLPFVHEGAGGAAVGPR